MKNKGWKDILITKPLREQTVELLTSSGKDFEIIPHITINPAKIPLKGAWWNEVQQVIITSKNAVANLSLQIPEEHIQAVNWKILCIDGYTQKRIKERFPNVQIVGAASDAESLVKYLNTFNPEIPVYHFCGNKSLKTLGTACVERGLEYKPKVVYKTYLVYPLHHFQYRTIAFFSPSAVESYAKHNRFDSGTVHFAIGKTTASAIEKYTENVFNCNTTDETAVINSIIDYFAN